MFRLTVENLDGDILRELELRDGTITIGRGSDCDVKLASASVSRRHARITCSGDAVVVEDLGSANGVLIAGAAIHGPTDLRDAAAAVGEFMLRVGPADTAWASAATVDPLRSTPPRFPDPGASIQTLSLVRFGDDHEGERLSLVREDVSLGRVSRCDLQVVHPSVSRHHARILRRGDQYILVDEGSSNGTRVNNTIVTQPTVLRQGDVVQLGDVWFAITPDTEPVDTRRLTTQWVEADASQRESNRGLLVLITTMTLVVLVLGVVLLVLQMRTPAAPEVVDVAGPAGDPGETAFLSGTQLAADGDFVAALEQFEAASAASPDLEGLAQAMEAARIQRDARVQWDACQRLLDDARQLEAAGTTLPAIEAYEAVRTCAAELPEASHARDLADTQLRDAVLPAMLDLRRYAGTLALQERKYGAAVASLDAALELARAVDAEPPSGLNSDLRRALLLQGDQAYGEQAWSDAASAYDRAASIEPLDQAWVTRLELARRNAGL